MPFQSYIEIFERVHVSGDITVKSREKFEPEQEDICEHCVSDYLAYGLDRLLSGIKLGEFTYQKRQDDQQGRSSGKGRCEEPGRHDGSQPEMPAWDTSVKEGRDSVDADGPWDRKIYQRLHPIGWFNAFTVSAQRCPADYQVQDQ